MKFLLLLILTITGLSSHAAYFAGESSPLRRNLSFGPSHTCMKGTQFVRCWGSNEKNQSSDFFAVPSEGVEQVAASADGSCLIKNRQLLCTEGLKQLESIKNPIQLAFGGSTTCVLAESGLHCSSTKEESDWITEKAPAFNKVRYVTVDPEGNGICVIDELTLNCWSKFISNYGPTYQEFVKEVKVPRAAIFVGVTVCAMDGEELKCSDAALPSDLRENVQDFAFNKKYFCTLNKPDLSKIKCYYKTTNPGGPFEAAFSFELSNSGTVYEHLILGDNILCAQSTKTDCWRLGNFNKGVLIEWDDQWYDNGDYNRNLQFLPQDIRNRMESPYGGLPNPYGDHVTMVGEVESSDPTRKAYSIKFNNFSSVPNSDVGYSSWTQANDNQDRFAENQQIYDCIDRMRGLFKKEDWSGSEAGCTKLDIIQKLYDQYPYEKAYGIDHRSLKDRYYFAENLSCVIFDSFESPREANGFLVDYPKRKFRSTLICYNNAGKILNQFSVAGIPDKLKVDMGDNYNHYSTFFTGLLPPHANQNSKVCVVVKHFDGKEHGLYESLEDIYCGDDGFKKPMPVSFGFDDQLAMTEDKSCFTHGKGVFCLNSIRAYNSNTKNLWTWPLNQNPETDDQDYSSGSVDAIGIIRNRTCDYKNNVEKCSYINERVCIYGGPQLMCQGAVFFNSHIHRIDQVSLESPTVTNYDLSGYLKDVQQYSSLLKGSFLLDIINYVDTNLNYKTSQTLAEQQAVAWCREKILLLLKPFFVTGTSSNFESHFAVEYESYVAETQSSKTAPDMTRLPGGSESLVFQTELFLLHSVLKASLNFSNDASITELQSLVGRVMAAPNDMNLRHSLLKSLENNRAFFITLQNQSKGQFLGDIYFSLQEELKFLVGVNP